MLPNTGTASSPALRDLLDRDGFIPRHIVPDEDQVSRILRAISVQSVDVLVADGHWPVDDNPLVNAPHTARALADE
jgi:hypothetical protein